MSDEANLWKRFEAQRAEEDLLVEILGEDLVPELDSVAIRIRVVLTVLSAIEPDDMTDAERERLLRLLQRQVRRLL